MVPGAVEDPAALAECLSGSDAVIYLIGILREDPARGVTFEALPVQGVIDTIAAARAAGVQRFVLMSANGVRPEGTPYQRTKYQAEQALMASPGSTGPSSGPR